MIRLFSESGPLAANDNWEETDPAGISATGLAPTDPREAALTATLSPGSYTVIVSGVQETQGVALVEFTIWNLAPRRHS